MPDRKRFSLTDRLRSFAHAIAGLRHVLATQHSAWIHAMATVVVIVAGLVLRVSASEWCWLTVAIGLVWAAEAFNTALESLADAVHPDQHPLVGKAKDAAAGAVLVMAVVAVIIGLIVFIPHIRALF